MFLHRGKLDEAHVQLLYRILRWLVDEEELTKESYQNKIQFLIVEMSRKYQFQTHFESKLHRGESTQDTFGPTKLTMMSYVSC